MRGHGQAAQQLVAPLLGALVSMTRNMTLVPPSALIWNKDALLESSVQFNTKMSPKGTVRQQSLVLEPKDNAGDTLGEVQDVAILSLETVCSPLMMYEFTAQLHTPRPDILNSKDKSFTNEDESNGVMGTLSCQLTLLFEDIDFNQSFDGILEFQNISCLEEAMVILSLPYTEKSVRKYVLQLDKCSLQATNHTYQESVPVLHPAFQSSLPKRWSWTFSREYDLEFLRCVVPLTHVNLQMKHLRDRVSTILDEHFHSQVVLISVGLFAIFIAFLHCLVAKHMISSIQPKNETSPKPKKNLTVLAWIWLSYLSEAHVLVKDVQRIVLQIVRNFSKFTFRGVSNLKLMFGFTIFGKWSTRTNVSDSPIRPEIRKDQNHVLFSMDQATKTEDLHLEFMTGDLILTDEDDLPEKNFAIPDLAFSGSDLGSPESTEQIFQAISDPVRGGEKEEDETTSKQSSTNPFFAEMLEKSSKIRNKKTTNLIESSGIKQRPIHDEPDKTQANSVVRIRKHDFEKKLGIPSRAAKIVPRKLFHADESNSFSSSISSIHRQKNNLQGSIASQDDTLHITRDFALD